MGKTPFAWFMAHFKKQWKFWPVHSSICYSICYINWFSRTPVHTTQNVNKSLDRQHFKDPMHSCHFKLEKYRYTVTEVYMHREIWLSVSSLKSFFLGQNDCTTYIFNIRKPKNVVPTFHKYTYTHWDYLFSGGESSEMFQASYPPVSDHHWLQLVACLCQ